MRLRILISTRISQSTLPFVLQQHPWLSFRTMLSFRSAAEESAAGCFLRPTTVFFALLENGIRYDLWPCTKRSANLYRHFTHLNAAVLRWHIRQRNILLHRNGAGDPLVITRQSPRHSNCIHRISIASDPAPQSSPDPPVFASVHLKPSIVHQRIAAPTNSITLIQLAISSQALPRAR